MRSLGSPGNSRAVRFGVASVVVLALGSLGFAWSGRDSGDAEPRPENCARPADTPSAGRALFVSPHGSDANPGTRMEPLGTLLRALRELRPGDTLYVCGGTYRERVVLASGKIETGTPDLPVTVKAFPGERPVIEGLLWLQGADYWVIDGINVTWSDRNASSEHMVKFEGGTGWRITGAELWGARSYAALLVLGGARDFRVDNLYVHDTHPTNDLNQDHLVYVSNGPDGSGVIERNVLAGSRNGRGIKLGPGSLDDPGTENVVIRFNTLYDNRGPANIQLSGSTSNNEIHGNVMVGPKEGEENVTAWELTGTGNVVRENLGWDSAGVGEFDGHRIVDGGGNERFDPRFADPSNGNFRPEHPDARTYGHLAAGDTGAAGAAADTSTIGVTAASS